MWPLQSPPPPWIQCLRLPGWDQLCGLEFRQYKMNQVELEHKILLTPIKIDGTLSTTASETSGNGQTAFLLLLKLSKSLFGGSLFQRYVSLWNLGSYQFSNITESPHPPQKVNPSISIVLVMQACLPNFGGGYQFSSVTESPQLPQKSGN